MERRTLIAERSHRLDREAYRGEVIVSITACVKDRRELFTDRVPVDACVHSLCQAALRFECT
ncbi:MAG TPA: hypothetical protein VMT89_18690, partial [Candidatus Acidoferrales bacterium]|nr:hypothetical protein [Candidatus Acidoferrales bacterium]